MRIHLLSVAIAGAFLAAGCSKQQTSSSIGVAKAGTTGHLTATAVGTHIASLPDAGELLRYDRSQRPVQRGGYSYYPVQMSEQRALGAIAEGGMVFAAPDGSPIRMQYSRHVEHDDGNWTWVGKTEHGEALLTFGEKAVFGTIPGKDGELQVTTIGGRTWVVQGNPSVVASAGEASSADFVRAPAAHVSAGAGQDAGLIATTSGIKSSASAPSPMEQASAPQAVVASAAVPAPVAPAATVDVVLGYTTGFATRLGGKSQALTRLNYLVDLTNQAYVDSQVNAQVRMVGAVQVNYPDATSNQDALFEFSGLSCSSSTTTKPRTPDNGENCTPAAVPAALQPLVAARDAYGADLVSLVRTFNDPENGSCGISWLIGAAQTPISADDARYGYSIVSDSGGSAFPDNGNTCREEYLAHEFGHNMGLQHDRATAQGTDDTNGDRNLLDPEEYGRYPYAFGYSTGTNAGNFYTIMSLRRTGQTGYRVFSNPRISTCGGLPCGVANQNDEAMALGQTMPVIASFRYPIVPSKPLIDRFTDINGDGRSDIFWSNRLRQSSDWWLMNGTTWTYGGGRSGKAVADQYFVAGRGDFDGDGRSDILWDDGASLWIWHSEAAGGFTVKFLAKHPAGGWAVAGTGDINHDGRDDIFWSNRTLQSADWWLMNGTTFKYGGGKKVASQYGVVGLGDFDGDGRSDVLWTDNAQLWIWHSEAAGGFTAHLLANHPQHGWNPVGIADLNRDGRSDIFWSNRTLQSADWWLMNGTTWTYGHGKSVPSQYSVAGLGDFDGDGRSDVLWVNDSAMWIWHSEAAGGFTVQSLAKLPAGWSPQL